MCLCVPMGKQYKRTLRLRPWSPQKGLGGARIQACLSKEIMLPLFSLGGRYIVPWICSFLAKLDDCRKPSPATLLKFLVILGVLVESVAGVRSTVTPTGNRISQSYCFLLHPDRLAPRK